MRWKLMFAACLAFLAMAALANEESAKQLQDSDPKVREKAAKQLGDEDEPANVAVLAIAVQDGDEKVRMAVVKSLIHLGSPASLQPLSTAVRDGLPEIRFLAIDGLVDFYLPGYLDRGFGGFFRSLGNKVEGLFSDVNTAVVAPGVTPDPEVVRTLAVTLNGAADMETRVRCAKALGILRAQDAVPDLLKAAYSNDVALIIEVLRALQKIKDTSAGPRLSFLLSYPQKSVQESAAVTMGLLRTESAIPQLESLLQSNDDKDLRAAALEALAYMPKKEIAPLFVKYLAAKDKQLRTSSALALGRLRDAENLRLLEQAEGKEKDMEVRLALDFALVDEGKMDALKELVANLSSKVHRGEARPYLIELAREQPVRDALRPSLYATDPEIRKNLCMVYAASGDMTSIVDLEGLLKDRDADVANEASRAITAIRSRGM